MRSDSFAGVVAVLGGVVGVMLFMAGVFALSVAFFYYGWNVLAVWAFPSLPVATWGQALVAAIAWSMLSSAFGAGKRARAE